MNLYPVYFGFDTSGQGFAFTGSSGDLTGGWQSAGGTYAGCWYLRCYGRNKSGTGYIELSTTWEALGIPVGSTVNAIQGGSIEYRCEVFNTGISFTFGPVTLHDASGVLQTTLLQGINGSGTTAWQFPSLGGDANPAGIQASGSAIRIRIGYADATGNAASAEVRLLVDSLSLTIDYTPAGTDYVQSLGDSVTASEEIIRAFDRLLPDGVTASDGHSRVSAFARMASESVNPQDSQARTIGRSLTDQATVVDANTREAGTGRSQSLSDSVVVSEATNRERSITKNLSDGVAASELSEGASTFTRGIADGATPVDAPSTSQSWNRVLADEIAPQETLASVKTMSKALADSATAGDSSFVQSSASLSGKIVLLARRIGQEAKALWNAIAGKADANHNHDGAYLGIGAKASDSDKLDGKDSTEFSLTGHSHSGVYEPVIAKSAGYLTWNGSAWIWKNETYATGTHNHDATYQPLDGDLSAISALSGTAGLLRKTAANTWTLDTAAYLTSITKAMVEAVLTGTVTSHNHAGTYEPAFTATGPIFKSAGTLWLGYRPTQFEFDGVELSIKNYSSFITSLTKAMVEAVLTGTVTSHNHSGAYELPLQFSTGLNRVTNTIAVSFGTTTGTVCQGNDARLSDARTPTDASVGYAKLASDLTNRFAVVFSNIDWNAGGVFTKTVSSEATFTFSNLALNKVITLILTGDFAITLPIYCKRISGTYDGTQSNYIQFHCTNAASGSEEVWYTINQQAT